MLPSAVLVKPCFFFRVLAQLELDFNSVERIVEYFNVPQEAPAIIDKCRPPAYWPSSSGELVVENLVVKYAPDLPAVLQNISFTVKPSEKIGVVRVLHLFVGSSLTINLRSEEQALVGYRLVMVRRKHLLTCLFDREVHFSAVIIKNGRAE